MRRIYLDDTYTTDDLFRCEVARCPRGWGAPFTLTADDYRTDGDGYPLCPDCNMPLEEHDDGEGHLSDHAERMHERRSLGLVDF